MKKIYIAIIALLSMALVSVGIGRPNRVSGLGDLAIELFDVSGQPFNGEARVYFKQAVPNMPSYSLGPHTLDFVNGLGFLDNALEDLQAGFPGTLTVTPIGLSQHPARDDRYFLDKSLGIKGFATVTPSTQPNGDLLIAARNMKLGQPPLIATLDVTNATAGSALTFEVGNRLSRYYDGRPSHDVLQSSSPTGGKFFIYSHEKESLYRLLVTNVAGQTSGVLEFLHGSDLDVIVESHGDIAVNIANTFIDEVREVLLFPSSSYAPLTIPAGSANGTLGAALLLRSLESSLPPSRQNNSSIYRFDDVNAGAYKLEVWTFDSSNLLLDPVLHSTVDLSAVAGQVTQVGVN